MSLVGRLVPPVTQADLLAGLMRAQRLLHARGITAWQDAWLGGSDGYPDPSKAYLAAATDGSLTATVAGALWWERECGADGEPVGCLQEGAMSLVGRLVPPVTQDRSMSGDIENIRAAIVRSDFESLLTTD